MKLEEQKRTIYLKEQRKMEIDAKIRELEVIEAQLIDSLHTSKAMESSLRPPRLSA